jgi:hypothetical protein
MIFATGDRAKLDKLQGRKVDVTWPHEEMMPEDAEFWRSRS